MNCWGGSAVAGGVTRGKVRSSTSDPRAFSVGSPYALQHAFSSLPCPSCGSFSQKALAMTTGTLGPGVLVGAGVSRGGQADVQWAS